MIHSFKPVEESLKLQCVQGQLQILLVTSSRGICKRTESTAWLTQAAAVGANAVVLAVLPSYKELGGFA